MQPTSPPSSKNETAQEAGSRCSGIGQLISPRLFKALADPNRIAILARLSDCCGPSTVSELASCCPVDLSVVSRHLGVLRDAAILRAEKRGRQVYYSLDVTQLISALRRLADALERCCPPQSTPPSQETTDEDA